MNKILLIACLALCATTIRLAGQTSEMPPAWAYPQAANQQRPQDDGRVHRLEGSASGFTATQINDPFAPPDVLLFAGVLIEIAGMFGTESCRASVSPLAT